MTPTSIYLLRHGACEGGQIFRGRTDSACTPAGHRQLLDRLASLPPLAAVATSPLQRCSAAARAFAAARSLPCVEQPAFAEIDFGDWEGRAVTDIEQVAPAAIRAFWRDPVAHPPPGAETLPDFQARVRAGWQSLLGAYRGQTLVLVTHGGVLRILLAELLGMPLRPLSHLHVPHGCLSLVRYFHAPDQPDWPQLIFHNGRATDEN